MKELSSNLKVHVELKHWENSIISNRQIISLKQTIFYKELMSLIVTPLPKDNCQSHHTEIRFELFSLTLKCTCLAWFT